MILTRLVEFAEGIDELPPSGYQPRFITKAIRLRGNGEFMNVQPVSGETRGKRSGQTIIVPQESPRRASGIVPRLIADNVNYALGKAREKDNPDDVAKRHQVYCGLIAECAKATGEARVLAIEKWINDGGPTKLQDDPSIEEDDDFIFEVDGVLPTDLPSIREFWISRAKAGAEGICLVTGKFGPLVDRMPAPIKGVPEGQMSGTALISINNPSGESYGLSAALNSPISLYAAENAGNALNYLLASSVHSIRVGRAVYVFWTKNPEGFSWEFLNDPKSEDVQRLLESPAIGKVSAIADAKDFFILAMTANVSRIVIRDYHETTLDAVKANLGKWFGRLELVGPDGQKGNPLGLFRLAVSLFREAKDMPAHVPTALLASAISGRPLPDYLLGLAVKRNLAMQGPYTEYRGRRRLSYERLALIKVLLSQHKEDIELKELNESHPDSAYHCGRLMAILERIQRAALGDINATVVDRFYGAACASPGTILGNLVNDAQSHLGKLRKERKDYHHQLRLEQVLSAIGDHFPKTLNLPRQGLFALGYYQQKAADRAAAAKHKELQVEGEKE
ncbi:MAG: type I-C CRISPR-associated protein Cas8c/Csd1 [Armatimonadetes bacterium]|nr:type I-C CRISPR-associated protein Cas8c/Csd1 [Armatimonadota bacterium]